jgi:hypothetical protein
MSNRRISNVEVKYPFKYKVSTTSSIFSKSPQYCQDEQPGGGTAVEVSTYAVKIIYVKLLHSAIWTLHSTVPLQFLKLSYRRQSDA